MTEDASNHITHVQQQASSGSATPQVVQKQMKGPRRQWAHLCLGSLCLPSGRAPSSCGRSGSGKIETKHRLADRSCPAGSCTGQSKAGLPARPRAHLRTIRPSAAAHTLMLQSRAAL